MVASSATVTLPHVPRVYVCAQDAEKCACIQLTVEAAKLIKNNPVVSRGYEHRRLKDQLTTGYVSSDAADVVSTCVRGYVNLHLTSCYLIIITAPSCMSTLFKLYVFQHLYECMLCVMFACGSV